LEGGPQFVELLVPHPPKLWSVVSTTSPALLDHTFRPSLVHAGMADGLSIALCLHLLANVTSRLSTD
jgi:hypothetical protein